MQYEPLEKRCLLDGSPLDPHGMFPGEVFLADSEILQSVDFDGDTVPDLVGLSTQLSILMGRGDGTFQPRTRLDIGNVLGGLSVTDLDGDSSPDIAVTNAQRNSVVVLQNQGDGSFETSGTYSVDGEVSSIVAAEVSGDTHVDLVMITKKVQGFGSPTLYRITILPGLGDGTFGAAEHVLLNERTDRLVASDLNGDDKIDVAVKNDSGQDVRVLLGNGDGTFGAPISSTVGVGIGEMELADFDGDDVPDLIAAQSTANSQGMVALHGQGDGTFAAAVQYPVGFEPSWITAADVNGDGSPDVLSHPKATNIRFFSVHLNNGDGTFLQRLEYATPANCMGLAVADFTGDGALDVARGDGARVSVIAGNGDGTFQEFAKYAAGTSYLGRGAVGWLAEGDLDGDGHRDLVRCNGDERSISVFFGSGGGRFAQESLYTLPRTVETVAVADLDGDGAADVVVEGAAQIHVLMNNGDGTLAAPVTMTSELLTAPIQVSDVDGDGVPDILTTGSTVSAYFGNGDGTFPAATPLAPSLPSGGFDSLAVADLDRNGTVDFVGASLRDYAAYLGDGDGTFSEGIRYDFLDESVQSMASGDVNGDRLPDLIVVADTSRWGISTFVGLGNGDGTFARPQRCNDGGVIAAVADLNGDGFDDVLTDRGLILLGHRDGTLTTHVEFDVLWPNLVADLDGDGVLDIAATNQGGIQVLLGIGDGTFRTVSRTQGEPLMGGLPGDVALADLDGDGWLDAVTANGSESDGESLTISVRLGDGLGGFGPLDNYDVGGHPTSLAIDDLDGDAVPDIVTGNETFRTVSVLAGNGDGSFREPAEYDVMGQPIDVILSDVNGDWLPDIVVAVERSVGCDAVSVRLGSGDGTFGPERIYRTGDYPAALAAGDLNGDDAVDLVTADSQDTTISVLFGDGAGGFAPPISVEVGDRPYALAIGDLDGDGAADIAGFRQGDQALFVSLNGGDGTFDSYAAYGELVRDGELKIVDLNGDDVADIVGVGTNGNILTVWLGTGDGTFGDWALFAASDENNWGDSTSLERLAVGDLDSDDRPDVVAAGGRYRDRNIHRFLQSQSWDVRHAPDSTAASPVDSLRVFFPQPMDINSYSVGDDVASFTGPNGAVTVSGYEWVNRSTLELIFPAQTAAGDYELVLGPDILDSFGRPVDLDGDGGGEADDDQYVAGFRISPPAIVSHSHAGGITGPIDSLRLTFDTAMDPSSFSLAEDIVSFHGPGGPIAATGFTWISPYAMDVTFPAQSAAGPYAMVVGPNVFDLGGNPMADAYTAEFSVRGPQIVRHTPSGATAAPLSSVQIGFDRPMDTGSFALADDIVGFTGPAGAVTVTGYNWLDEQTLEISFDPQAAHGAYALTLGPQILDTSGNPLDEDKDLDAGEAVDDRYVARFLLGSIVTTNITTDTTWSGLVIVEGRVSIAAGATVTVGSGTIVKFKNEGTLKGRLTINGILDVQGTEAEPVVFTSMQDDSAGGDTNQDGQTTAAASGDWERIDFSGAEASTVSWAQFRYAEGASYVLDIVNSSPTLSHVLVAHTLGSAVRVTGTSQPVISDLRAEDCRVTGLVVDGVRPGNTVMLSGITVDGAQSGILIDARTYSGATNDTIFLQGAQLRNIGSGWPLEVADSINLTNLDLASIEIDGNTCERGPAIQGGMPTADLALDPRFVWNFGGVVGAGTTLTIPAGTVVKGSGLTVEGTLDARGTTIAPIILTSLADDRVGGDTNADGTASHPRDDADAPEITFLNDGASRSVLEHAEIRYGGSISTGPSGTLIRAPIQIDGAAPRLSDVTIRHAVYRAVDLLNGAAPTITNLTVQNCYVTDQGLGGDAIYVRAGTGAFTMDGVVLQRVENWPLYLESVARWDQFSGLEIDSDTNARGSAGYIMGGTLFTHVTPLPDVVWQTAGFTIANAGTLTLQPGTVLKGPRLTVEGTLNVQGTQANPVVLTSPQDDTAGGDTDADGGGHAPSPGSGFQVHVTATGQATIEYVDLRAAPDQAIRVEGGQADLVGCRIDGAQGSGVFASGGQVTLTDCIVFHATGSSVLGRFGADLILTGNLLVNDQPDANVVEILDVGTTLTLVNNTIVGGMLGVMADGQPHLSSAVNNIIAFNSGGGIAILHAATFDTDIRYNNVYNPGGVNYMNMEDLTGTLGNISADPLFVDRAGGDLRLAEGSPSVDAADGDVAPEFDRTGLPRFDDLGAPNTGRGNPVHVDMGSEERVRDSASDIDLIVVAGSISGPASAAMGETVTVQWTIRNDGAAPAVGPWLDRIFLHRMPTVEDTGYFIGEVLVGDGVTLGPGEQLPVFVVVDVPPTTMGELFWQVQTNARQDVFEGLNRLNNLARGDDGVLISLPELEIGVPTAGAMDEDGDVRYYVLPLPVGQEVLLTLDDADDSGANELYVRLNELPTRSQYDFAGTQHLTADQRIQLASTSPAYAYVMIYGRDVANVPAEFTITAKLPGFDVHRLTPDRGGNAGQVTVLLQGEGLPDDGSVWLVRGEGDEEQRIWGRSVDWRDGANLYVTFDLRDAATEFYDLAVIRQDGTTSIREDAFEVVEGAGAKLEARVVTPSPIRQGQIFPITIQYSNVGDVDMPAPLLTLDGPVGLEYSLSTDISNPMSDLQFVAASSSGPAGILQPGDRETIALYATANIWNTVYTLSLGQFDTAQWTLPDSDGLVDWTAIEDQWRSPFITDDQAWADVWNVFTVAMGDRWEDVLQHLSQRVTERGYRRDDLLLADGLLAGEMQRAIAFGGEVGDQSPPFVYTRLGLAGPSGGLAGVDLIFSESIGPATFGIDDLELVGPAGVPIAGLVLEPSPGTERLFHVTFPEQTAAGLYTLSVGPDVTDLAGLALDQNFSGVGGQSEDSYEALLEVPGGTTPLGAISALGDPPLVNRGFWPFSFAVNHFWPLGEVNRLEGIHEVYVRFTKPFYPKEIGLNLIYSPSGLRPDSPFYPNLEIWGPVSQTVVDEKTIRYVFEDVKGPTLTLDKPGWYFPWLRADYPSYEWYPESGDITPKVVDHDGPRILRWNLPQGFGHWSANAVTQLDVYFNEPVMDLKPSHLQIVPPNSNTVQVTSVTCQNPGSAVKPYPKETEWTWWRFEFTETGTDEKAGTYEFTVSPTVGTSHILDIYGYNLAPWPATSAPKNRMDNDGDGKKGEIPDDQLKDTFLVVDQVPVISGEITIEGGFGGGAHVAVQLWEKEGDTVDVGNPLLDGEPDVFVSDWNFYRNRRFIDYKLDPWGDLVTDRWTENGFYGDGKYLFWRTSEDKPLSYFEDEEGTDPAEYYVVVLPKNDAAFVVHEATISLQPPVGFDSHSSTPLYPQGLPTGMTPLWAQQDGVIHMVPDPDPNDPTNEIVLDISLDPSDPSMEQFRFSELIWRGNEWLHDGLGHQPAHSVAVAFPDLDTEGWAAFWDVKDYISVGHGVDDPFEILHAYGEALHFAANNYSAVHRSQTGFGMIFESPDPETPWPQAWANFYAARSTADLWPLDGIAPVNQWRSSYLETNNYWMGHDGYGLEHNLTDAELGPPPWSWDGVNDNANEGWVVMGAIMSIFWDLADGLPSEPMDDDGVYDIPAMWQGLQGAGSMGSVQTFWDAIPRNAGIARIFIDHGCPVMDDNQEENDTEDELKDLGLVNRELTINYLVLAEEHAGQGDWFEFTVPYNVHDSSKQYDIQISVNSIEYIGKMDVILKGWIGEEASGRPRFYEVRENTSSFTVSLKLEAQTYTFHLGVMGHGASGFYDGGDYTITPEAGMGSSAPPLPPVPIHTWNIVVINAYDPNEKAGPPGAGASHHIAATALMPYIVYFENDPDKATAPAQKVVITDQLDQDLDWATFQFDTIRFGEQILSVPPDRLHYETDVRVSYDDYPVHVIADFDPKSGLVTWEMYSYDAMTGAAPRDPLAGFLPVNNELRQGEGFVTFTVQPKADRTTGTEIRNHAEIVFDVNEPIVTNEVLNTIDSLPPDSEVLALPAYTSQNSIAISWAGADESGQGSGIATFDVYVSVDGQPFERWLAGNTATTATFAGERGRTYAFYSVAIDQVGHRESAPPTADAQTTLVANLWHNYADPYDVNGQDGATALDVLIIINYINAHLGDSSLPAAPAVPPPYYDVTDDGLCTANDVLQVINYINAHLSGLGAEGENADLAQVSNGTNGDGWFAEPTIIRPHIKMTESFLGSRSRYARVSSEADNAPDRLPTDRARKPAARSSKMPFTVKPLFGTEHERAEFVLDIETILPDIAEDIHDAWCFARQSKRPSHPSHSGHSRAETERFSVSPSREMVRGCRFRRG